MPHRWGTASRHERGYGSAWVKLREVIIARDLGLCQPCKREGRVTPFKAVDHIRPKSQGGTDEPDNLECICRACHDAKTHAESEAAKGRAPKQRPRFADDGRVIWPG